MKKCLLFMAHPDDAEIAMGGTIAKLVHQGNLVKNVIVSIPDYVDVRKQEVELASRLLNVEYAFCDNPVPCQVEEIAFSALVRTFDRLVEEFGPDIVFTHWDSDSHQDHKIVSQATQIVSRKHAFDLYFVEQINQRNVVRSNKFAPNTYVDISQFLDKKLDAIKCYASQLTGYMNHYLGDAAVLAQWRGHQINTRYAEAFEQVIRREI